MNRTLVSIRPGHLLSGVLFLATAAAVASASAAAADNSVGNVSRGALSWSQNCARCHEMRDPTEFRDDLWKPIMAHMRIRAGLTGQQQRDILAFLQAANNPLLMKVSTSAPGQVSGETALPGKVVYDQTCVACHGADGTGTMPGTPNFAAQNGPLSKSDEVLVKHITQGFQTPGSPMAMPAMGGNPNLSTADVRSVISYMRQTFGSR